MEIRYLGSEQRQNSHNYVSKAASSWPSGIQRNFRKDPMADQDPKASELDELHSAVLNSANIASNTAAISVHEQSLGMPDPRMGQRKYTIRQLFTASAP